MKWAYFFFKLDMTLISLKHFLKFGLFFALFFLFLEDTIEFKAKRFTKVDTIQMMVALTPKH